MYVLLQARKFYIWATGCFFILWKRVNKFAGVLCNLQIVQDIMATEYTNKKHEYYVLYTFIVLYNMCATISLSKDNFRTHTAVFGRLGMRYKYCLGAKRSTHCLPPVFIYIFAIIYSGPYVPGFIVISCKAIWK